MKGYSIIIEDPSKQYGGNLNVGQLIKVSAEIDTFNDFIGLIVNVNNATVEVIR